MYSRIMFQQAAKVAEMNIKPAKILAEKKRLIEC
jgi:hypothetical protein